jgi:aminoglycoside phosphotransferase (APT) family kinase protein
MNGTSAGGISRHRGSARIARYSARSDYIASYCARCGREGIGNWNFYLAYNLFRIAAILQGVAKRALEGTASSAQALDAGRRARPLAELGWKYAERAMKQS